LAKGSLSELAKGRFKRGITVELVVVVMLYWSTFSFSILAVPGFDPKEGLR
jgi:hypothetical protein